MKTVGELKRMVREYEHEQAYGSETSALGLFVGQYGYLSNDDDANALVSEDDWQWWEDYYEAQGLLDELDDDLRDEVQELLDRGCPSEARELAESL